MSIRAMLLAIPVHLRAELSLDDDECDTQPDARPPTQFGEKYIAVCEDGIQGAGTRSDGASTLKKSYQFKVTVTRRTGQYGRDRTKKLYLEELDSMDQLATAVIAAIHGSYPLINLANAEITGGANPYTLPLWFLGQSPIQPQDASWAYVAKDTDSSTYLATVLRFGGAIRVQTIGLAQ